VAKLIVFKFCNYRCVLAKVSMSGFFRMFQLIFLLMSLFYCLCGLFWLFVSFIELLGHQLHIASSVGL
jgi:hypothetical protein